MPAPIFLVIGAGRSGTTSLHHYLQAHPQVYVPDVKSPSHFYCRGLGDNPDPVTHSYFVPDPAHYRALFDGVRGERAVGEVSPAYLAAVHVPARIADELPGVRLIAIFRNPVDRAFARFVARSRDGLERRSFAEIIEAERREGLHRDDAAGTYLPAGFVSRFLRPYLERFPAERIRVYFFEELQRDAERLLRDIYTFLGVDPAFLPDLDRRYNASGGTIANPVLREAWTRTAMLRARVRRHVPGRVRDSAFAFVTRRVTPATLDPGLRRDLTDLYRDEIEQLGSITGRDLSEWLSPLRREVPEARHA